MHAYIYCKNKLVVLTSEWLPWWQISQRYTGFVLYKFADYLRQLHGEEAFPDYLTTSILQIVTTEHLCNNNQDRADIVTTEHL